MWDGGVRVQKARLGDLESFENFCSREVGPGLLGSEFGGSVCVWCVTVGSIRLSHRVSRMEGRRAWACILASSFTWMGDKVLDFVLFCFSWVLFSISQPSVHHPSNIVTKFLFCVFSRCEDTEVDKTDTVLAFQEFMLLWRSQILANNPTVMKLQIVIGTLKEEEFRMLCE